MARKERNNLKRQIVETYRRKTKQEGDRVDNFDFSVANGHVITTPMMVYDLAHLINLISQVYHVLGRRGGEGGGRTPDFNSRQKQVIAFCIYLEERGSICDLQKSDDGVRYATFRSDEEIRHYIDAICLLNGLERREAGEAVRDFVRGGADYVQDHVNAIEEAGGTDLESDDEDDEEDVLDSEDDEDDDSEDDSDIDEDDED